MMFYNVLAIPVLVGAALALPQYPSPPHGHPNHTYEPGPGPVFPKNMGCGEVNVFYTGLTAYHPYVIAQGLDPKEVDPRLRGGAAKILQAGYNLRVMFQGPEQPVSNIADRMKDIHYHIDAQGMGLRGYANATATHMFEDNLYQFQRSAPHAPTVFNWGPDTFAESISARIPLRENCTDKPGKLIAYEELCEVPNVCAKATVILDGDINKLLE